MNQLNYEWRCRTGATEFKIKTSRFHAKEKVPKSYKYIGLFRIQELEWYNSGLAYLYKTSNGYSVAVYVDGCFWKQFAKTDINKDIIKLLI